MPSSPRRHLLATWLREVHCDLHSRRRHNTVVKAFQVRFREGGCHVCAFCYFFLPQLMQSDDDDDSACMRGRSVVQEQIASQQSA